MPRLKQRKHPELFFVRFPRPPLVPGKAALPGWLAGLLLAAPLQAGAAPWEGSSVADLSLEEIAQVRVTSVSKKAEPLISAPASVFVITGEEIRRSGAHTLPEALSLAPNLQVAQVDARNYAITARGSNNPFANKLLVLIDGRTVYSPLFSGVFWDAQDVVLEDVDRIEVISGPGGTMWGANAVNGVINVITKAAGATQGGLAGAGASKNEKQGVLRYGGSLDNGGYYRVYGKYSETDDTRNAAGTVLPTGMNRRQTGFRTDWDGASRRVTLQGDAYEGALHQFMTQDIRIAGANLLGRMEGRLANGSEASLQAYWDYTERKQPLAFTEYLNTLDLQFQHSLQAGAAHAITWGGGYRLAQDHVTSEGAFAFLPATLDMHWANVFVQDEIALRKDLSLTLGAKLENNNYTGTEFLPTVRLAWRLRPDQMLWSAASRAVRAPSRIDRDFYTPTNPPVVGGVPLYAVAGGPNFESEIANVLEIGYRAQPLATLSYSVTAFYSQYDRLRTLEANPAGFGTVFMNGGEGRARGVEMWGSWRPQQRLRLSAGLVTQKVSTELTPGHQDLSGATGLASSDPSHYWMLRASWDVAPRQELDLTLRRVGDLGDAVVPPYTALDLRYGWEIRRGLELSVVGQNLLDRAHPEFGTEPGRSQIERAVFVKLLWRQ